MKFFHSRLCFAHLQVPENTCLEIGTGIAYPIGVNTLTKNGKGKTMSKKIARIWYDTDGIHLSDDALPYLDARGAGFVTVADAYRAAVADGYTHAIVSAGAGRDEHRIPARYYHER